MSALKAVAGIESLRSIIARSSSARVLDLHSLALEAASDLDYQARPLFQHPVLNRTIIVKHHPRPGEFDLDSDRGSIITKVIFPFDPRDLDLGGQFLLVDDPDFLSQLERQLDFADIDMDRDILVLMLLDRLPTLDPFLLREVLAANKVDVAPCYFRLTPADRRDMLQFVSEQVELLIRLCFGASASTADQAKRLSALILAEGRSPELDPLRHPLRMTVGEFAQSMFCWKALLYYRWRSRLLGPEVKATRRGIAGLSSVRFDPDARNVVRTAVGRLEELISDCERGLASTYRTYDQVFNALTVERTPEPFRDFLVEGSKLFREVGDRMGRLEQLTSYWTHQFPEGRMQHLSPESVVEGLRKILNALSLRTSLTDANATAHIWRSDNIVRSTRRKAAGGAAVDDLPPL
jgi:hypothetical protein